MEAVTWTLIAMFGATVCGQFALINGIRKELGQLTARIGRLELRLDHLEERFDEIDEWRAEVDGWRRELTDRVVALER